MINNLLKSLIYFARQDHLSKAFKTFFLIQIHASSIASRDLIFRPISVLLLLCTRLRSLQQGKQIHAQIISLGFEQEPELVPGLVMFYSTFNHLHDARSVVWNSNMLHPLPWNVLIHSHVRKGLFGGALAAYKHMANKGIKPNNFTYPCVLKACGQKLDLAFGIEVHGSIDVSCTEWNLFVHTSLVSMYAKAGEMDIARCLFDKMLERDAVSWNALISGYASKGMWVDAFELFEKMCIEGFGPDHVTWSIIARGCSQTGNFKEALNLVSHMRNSGINFDSVSMIIGLSACTHIGALQLGKEIHCFTIQRSYDRLDKVRSALITMYSRCRDLRHAYILFQSTDMKSIITWNAMLSGYAHMYRSVEAYFLFREMLICGIEPDHVTVVTILSLCARVANLQHGKELHCYIMRHVGFKDNLLLWNALVEMYVRTGEVLEAQRVFDLMGRKDEVTYNSLILGYGRQRNGKAALKLFEEMSMFQIKPNYITMILVLSACSESGLVREGHILFEKMAAMYDIPPQLEHFSCMVDLFARAGLLYNAKEIVTRMPGRPSYAMLISLLRASQVHRNKEIREWAVHKLNNCISGF